MAVVSVLPGVLDFLVKRGDTVVGQLQFTNDDGSQPDLSDWTSWLAQIRATLDEPPTILGTFTVDTTNIATGLLEVTLAASASAALTTSGGRATNYWDIQASKDDGTVRTWLGGKFKVFGDVSVVS